MVRSNVSTAYLRRNLGGSSFRADLGKQRGAALILALVVVVLVVLLSSTLSSDFLVTFRRVENQLLGKQAYAYMRGAEGIARQILQQDFEANTGRDHHSEGWLNQRVEFPLQQGAIAGTLCDLQGRFNLNNLLAKAAGGSRYTVDQAMFIRLLQTLELETPLEQQQAEDITNALIDWLDKDGDISSTGGAEAGYYSEQEQPLRAANRPLQSLQELRWLKGMTVEIIAALQDYVVVLEPGVPLNINTARAEVLRSINTKGQLIPISLIEAESIVNDRDGDSGAGSVQQEGGFDNVGEFISSHPATTLNANAFSVTSNYYLLHTETIFSDRDFELYSILFRNNDGVIKTITRARSGFGHCNAEEENDDV